MLSISSSRRLSSIHQVMDCPRLSYLYPFPPTTSRFHPWLSARQFLTSIFTSTLPFLNSKKFVKLSSSSSIPFSRKTIAFSLSPHSQIINKFIENRPDRVKKIRTIMRKNPHYTLLLITAFDC